MTAPGTFGTGKVKLEADGSGLIDAMSKAFMAAFSKLENQAGQGADQIGKALASVPTAGFTSAMDQAAAAVGDVAKESGRVTGKGFDEAAQAAQKAAKAAAEAAKSTKDTGDEADKSGHKMRDAFDGAGDGLAELGKKAAEAAIAFAGVEAAAELIGSAIEQADMAGKLKAQLDLTSAESERVGKIAGDLFTSAYGDSLEQVNDAIGSVKVSMSDLGVTSDAQITAMTKAALDLASTFGIDVAESTQTVSQLIRTGLAKDGTEAADLLTAALQRVSPALREGVVDAINEYGTYFHSIGFTGPEAMGALVNAAKGGEIALDKAGDAVKEFGIRATDLGDTGAQTALSDLGFVATDMSQKLLAGGDTAKNAFDQIVSGLQNVQDPAKQAQLAVALFGTPLEDLDKAKIPGFLAGLQNSSTAMDGFSGAAGRMDEALQTPGSRLEGLKRTIQQGLIDALGSTLKFFQDFPAAGYALAAVLGVITAAYIGIKIQALASAVATGISTAATAGATLAADAGIVSQIAYRLALVGGTVATVAATAATWAFNAAMLVLTSPITLIIVAIAALVAGLVWFFTQTDIGKKIFQGFVDFLVKAWGWIQGAFAAAWGFIKPILDGLWTLLQWIWQNVIQPVFTAIAIAIGVVATGFVLAWDIIKGIFDLWWAYVQWIWENVFSPIFGFIGDAFTALGAVFGWVWENVIQPAWNALGDGLQWVWDNIISPLWEIIKAGLQVLGDTFSWIWANVIQPAWQALGDGISWVWNNIVSPVWEALKAALNVVGSIFSSVWNNIIKPAWDALGDGISWVWENVISPAWDAMKGALNSLSSFFSNIVDGIGKAWDGMKRLLAKPVNFLIGTVWNNGILKAWNKVAEFIPGLSPAKELGLIPEMRTGGALSGPGTGTSDDILMYGSNGEHMVTAMEVIKAGGQDVLYAIRDMISRGIPFEWDNGKIIKKLGKNNLTRYGKAIEAKGIGNVNPDGLFSGLTKKFATGGAVEDGPWVDQLERGHTFAQAQSGKPYVWGGSIGPDGGTDCSGYMSSIADVILGGNGLLRKWATGAFPGGGNSQGDNVNVGGQPWAAGLAQGMSIGVSSEHTAGTLSSAGKFPTAVNVESGGSHGNVMYGGASAGGNDGQFPTRYHLPIGPQGAFEGATDTPTPEEMRGLIAKKIDSVLAKILDPIKSGIAGAIGSPPPEYLGIPPKYLDTGREKISKWLADKAASLTEGLGSAWKKAKDLVGFDQGGVANGTGVMPKNTINPERVLSPGQTKAFDSLITWLTGDSHDFSQFAHQLGEAFSEACTPAMTQAVTDGTKAGTAAAAPDLSTHLATAAADAMETVTDGLVSTDAGLYDSRTTGLTDAELQEKQKEQWDALMKQLFGDGTGQQMGDSAASSSGMSGSKTQGPPPPSSGNTTTTVHAPVTVNGNNVDAESIAEDLGRILFELIR